MIEDLKKVRDALYDSKAEFWDDWHSNMSEGDFENHWLIMDIDKSLATIDRIIADHIPDASKMVIPDGYALVPIDPTRHMLEQSNLCAGIRNKYKIMIDAAQQELSNV